MNTCCCLLQAYPSQKPLAAWTRDLALRVEQFELWASRARPPVIFWLSGFTFPTGFLTAVLQSSARQNNVSPWEVVQGLDAGDMWLLYFSGILPYSHLQSQISVDALSWEFIVSTVDDSNLVYPPKVGARCAGGSERRREWETIG